jgi:hypothetical protein
MKNISLFMLVGVLAIVMTVVSFMGFDPKVDTWSSFIAGGAIAFLLIKSRSIIAYIKSKKQ